MIYYCIVCICKNGVYHRKDILLYCSDLPGGFVSQKEYITIMFRSVVCPRKILLLYCFDLKEQCVSQKGNIMHCLGLQGGCVTQKGYSIALFRSAMRVFILERIQYCIVARRVCILERIQYCIVQICKEGVYPRQNIILYCLDLQGGCVFQIEYNIVLFRSARRVCILERIIS